MLDVLHALYEEDSIPLYEEHAKVKSQVRVSMWMHLYHKDYPFPYNENATAMAPPTAGGLPPEESLLPSEDAPRERKPYIPPTDPEKLSQILDAPLG